MTRRILASVALLAGVALAGVALAAAPQPKPADELPPLVRPAKQGPAPNRALAYSFLPDPADQIAGNAAQTWLRAGLAARSSGFKWLPKHDAWYGPGEGGTALADLPLAEVKAALAKHGTALRAAERAALQSRCDWEYPPLTIQTLGDLGFDDIQMLRELSRVITLRCRMHLAEGKYEDAARDLRVGLTMARQTGDSQTLIQDLVAIAIASIQLSRVEEWVQKPGSPNLYWTLTELPRPLISVRKSFTNELSVLYRSYPDLRKLKANELSPAEAKALVEKVYMMFFRLADESGPAWKLGVGVEVVAIKYHAEAKKHLIASGRPAKQVEAMPATVALALYNLDEWDRVRDEFVRCVALPMWQSHAEIEKVDRIEMPKAKANGNLAIAMLMPAMTKVHAAHLRLERQVAGLRTAEAIRMHIAKRGAPPAKLADITEVPLPVDPLTNKPMDEWYVVEGGKATLTMPPPPGQPARIGRRYEFPVQGQ